jgi:hypothetical protein
VLVVATTRITAGLAATTLVILAVLVAATRVAWATTPVPLTWRRVVRVTDAFGRDALLEFLELQFEHSSPHGLSVATEKIQ